MLSIESKLIIFAIGFITVGIIGLIMDHNWDKRHGTHYDRYGNEISGNTTGGLIFLWCCFGGILLFPL